jgi:hypothetical protein
VQPSRCRSMPRPCEYRMAKRSLTMSASECWPATVLRRCWVSDVSDQTPIPTPTTLSPNGAPCFGRSRSHLSGVVTEKTAGQEFLFAAARDIDRNTNPYAPNPTYGSSFYSLLRETSIGTSLFSKTIPVRFPFLFAAARDIDRNSVLAVWSNWRLGFYSLLRETSIGTTGATASWTHTFGFLFAAARDIDRNSTTLPGGQATQFAFLFAAARDIDRNYWVYAGIKAGTRVSIRCCARHRSELGDVLDSNPLPIVFLFAAARDIDRNGSQRKPRPNGLWGSFYSLLRETSIGTAAVGTNTTWRQGVSIRCCARHRSELYPLRRGSDQHRCRRVAHPRRRSRLEPRRSYPAVSFVLVKGLHTQARERAQSDHIEPDTSLDDGNQVLSQCRPVQLAGGLACPTQFRDSQQVAHCLKKSGESCCGSSKVLSAPAKISQVVVAKGE